MSESRTQLNIKINAKTHWLVGLAARYWGMTQADFIESLIAKGITSDAMSSDEPRVNEPTGPSAMLWNESLWSDDEGTRLFNVATAAHGLLSDSQRAIWARIAARIAADGGRINLKTFCEHFEQMKGGK